MMRGLKGLVGLVALIIVAGCAAPQPDLVIVEEPLILAEPMAVEPLDACDGSDPDDGIGGTGCQPVVAKSVTNPLE